MSKIQTIAFVNTQDTNELFDYVEPTNLLLINLNYNDSCKITSYIDHDNIFHINITDIPSDKIELTQSVNEALMVGYTCYKTHSGDKVTMINHEFASHNDLVGLFLEFKNPFY